MRVNHQFHLVLDVAPWLEAGGKGRWPALPKNWDWDTGNSKAFLFPCCALLGG